MNTDMLCMGCMSKKGSEQECPHCGYEEVGGTELTRYLPSRTLLNEKYLVGRALGGGGFGVTYLAWDTSLKVKVAIKEYMPLDLSGRDSSRLMVSAYTGKETDYEYGLEQFIEEARALAKFDDHPGIVSVKEYFKENGTAYFVMPFVEGQSFKEYLEQQGGKISFDKAVDIVMPVMDALRRVHKTGMLHRDIAPDNIYITDTGQVKLIDFGAARVATRERSRSLSMILKPGFAPEEQYRSRGKQGPWTDVYAVAATLYRSITGELPPEALDRLDQDELRPLSRFGINITLSADKALRKALSVRAKDRFQTIKEFQDDLLRSASQPAERDDSSKTILSKQLPDQEIKTDSVTSTKSNSIPVASNTPSYKKKKTGGVNWAWILWAWALVFVVIILSFILPLCG